MLTNAAFYPSAEQRKVSLGTPLMFTKDLVLAIFSADEYTQYRVFFRFLFRTDGILAKMRYY